MGNDASWGVNQALKKIILNDSGLQDCFKEYHDEHGYGFCFSNPASLPQDGDKTCQNIKAFINIGKVRTRAWKSASFDGQSHNIHINIQDISPCNDGVNKVVSRLITLFHDCELTIKNHAVVEFQFEWSETTELIKGGWRAELCFHALTISD